MRIAISLFLAASAVSVTTAQAPAPATGPAPVMTIDEYDPKPLLVVPQHKMTRAKFPFIDVHNHQNRLGGPQLEALIKDMDDINMRVMVMLSGGNGDRLSKNIERQKKAFPDRVVVFANIDYNNIDAPDYADRAAAQLEADFKAGAQGLKIFKNHGMDLKDTHGKRIPVDDPRWDKVFEMCAKYKAPVLIHTAEPKGLFLPMDKDNERWLELKLHPGRGRTMEKYPPWEDLLAEQHHLFVKHPKVNFINAHLGWLGIDLARLGQLMDKMPNMYTEIGAVIEELGRQPRFARQFFVKYQDRILFGKDTWRKQEYGTYFRTLESADEYFDHDRKYHGIWKMYGLELPDEVLKKVYYKNALKLIPGMNKAGFPQ